MSEEFQLFGLHMILSLSHDEEVIKGCILSTAKCFFKASIWIIPRQCFCADNKLLVLRFGLRDVAFSHIDVETVSNINDGGVAFELIILQIESVTYETIFLIGKPLLH